MIHDIYFKDPFPINIPMDDLSDCYIEGNPGERTAELLESWGEIAVGNVDAKNTEDLRKIYIKMVYYYMEQNFKDKGLFTVIHDAYNLIKASMEDGTIRGFFKEYGIDFSHMFGFGTTDLQIVVVPFNNIEKALEMKDKIKFSNAIDIWNNDCFYEYEKTEDDDDGGEFEGIL